jgi:beta-N-acetylhexosaminidase
VGRLIRHVKKAPRVLFFFGVIVWALTTGVYGADEIPLREKIGQMLMVGFHGKRVSDSGVQTLGAQIRAGDVGGVLLFSYNLGTAQESRDLIRFLQSQSPRYPLLISVDQEGGSVARIRTKLFPSAKKMALKSVAESRSLYTEMGEMVATYGINVVLGPVVDLDHDPPSPAIGAFSRSYGFDSDTVVSYATAFIEGMHASNLVTAIKHFPGHGSAQGDTHAGLVDTTDVWSPEELAPYSAFPDADMVMVAHIVNRYLDASEMPASLSYPVVTGLLRDRMGYRGVVITDDLQMGAIQNVYPLQEVVTLAVLAGNDILLFGNNDGLVPTAQRRVGLPGVVIDVIEQAIQRGDIPVARIEDAYGRIRRLRPKGLSLL